MVMEILSICASLALFVPQVVASTQYEQYILAPKSRSVTATSVNATRGSVTNANALVNKNSGQAAATFSGVNSSVTLDFGKNIAGTVQFEIESVSGSGEYIGFTFTESSMWISPYQCDSGTSATFDSPLWFKISSTGTYAAEKKHQRGGFRYMSIWHNSTGILSLKNLSVNFTASPEMKDPSAYGGYFNSDSEKLNRVWYSGAYTNQLCSADPAYGNALGIPGTDWYYNATIANGTSALIDGGKRDRLVWPGDIAISGPSIFVSIGNLDSIKNGIDSIYPLQAADGRLPWAGVPFTNPGRFPFSFTYHHYTLLDTYDYYTYTGDLEFLRKYWPQFTKALTWSLATIDSSKLANVTSSNDWLRSGMGGHNVEANAILYHTLDRAIHLADAVGDDSVTESYKSAMEGIKEAINSRLWDPDQNLFFDNDSNKTASAVHPQDGNSWVIVAGVVDAERAAAISTSLAKRWVRPYGAPAPEAGPTISPFASGFEVQAHYLAGYPERAVDLMEFMWHDFMIADPRMTQSTFIEGYSTNGDLHYAPYDNDARISHAHGWATGPTSALTFLGAGLQVTSAEGKTWRVQPKLGGLKRISAGYSTPLGSFDAAWSASANGAISGQFRVPKGTIGSLILPLGDGSVKVEGPNGRVRENSTRGQQVTYEDLPGGSYKVRCS